MLLYLLRHAKSDWDASNDGDHKRPLSRRGVKAAGKIGRFARENDIFPDVIVSSTSKRTRQTIELVAEAANWLSIEPRFSDELYLASVEEAMQIIRTLPDSARSALLVGHQPCMSMLASVFLGGRRVEMPTAAFLGISLDIHSWEEAGGKPGKIAFHVLPRSLR